MKTLALTVAALAACLGASAHAEARRNAVQTATGSTVVNHAEGGSVSLSRSVSSTCPNDRQELFPISFNRPFANNQYVVTIGLATADVDNNANFRLQASVVQKTRDGMTIMAHTWCNTTVYSATFTYSAVGR
jgi:hypothetical protein